MKFGSAQAALHKLHFTAAGYNVDRASLLPHLMLRRLLQRLALGLACPPPPVDSLQDSDALHTARGGWLRLRPRWPLTEERHPRAVHRWRSACRVMFLN